jgi:hypothetical protein
MHLTRWPNAGCRGVISRSRKSQPMASSKNGALHDSVEAGICRVRQTHAERAYFEKTYLREVQTTHLEEFNSQSTFYTLRRACLPTIWPKMIDKSSMLVAKAPASSTIR